MQAAAMSQVTGEASAKAGCQGSSRRAGTLLVGLGSPHGDDCVGWCVASALAAALDRAAAPSQVPILVRLAQVPLELLHWCGELARLVIVDACVPAPCGPHDSRPSPGAYERWYWPEVPTVRLRPATSHDLGLADVLALGSSLQMLPPEVEIWGLWIAPESVRAASVSHSAAGTNVGGGPTAGASCLHTVPPHVGKPGCTCVELERQLSCSLRAVLPTIVSELWRSLVGPCTAAEDVVGPERPGSGAEQADRHVSPVTGRAHP